MVLDGFTDITHSLKCGVYALAYQGRIIYVGKSKSMLGRIYSHRTAKNKKNLPSWFPIKGLTFDEVHVHPCHPDRVDELEYKLVNQYKPRYNTQLKNNIPINQPFNLTINGLAITLCAPQRPSHPEIIRRI